ncbi:YozQ family protein [Halalkalibacter alkalisediminis]|uniref:YozQ family protein n=1 Tax=Halalkalibacter alkalisediminis TaxID=935616 RepID=A0ABV6NDE7_9BACI|nr:YozQ family protein [Halalkalibacter alkalisediminis]
MTNNKNEKLPKTEELAEHNYQPEDGRSSNEVEQGLATTHEQVNEMYEDGTIDRKADGES